MQFVSVCGVAIRVCKMEILNDSKVLPLSDIIVKLFNNSFLSDITFSVEQKEIRAHSFILMNRSIVYQQQFETNQGEQKLIPIQSCDYVTFYQFVRFIYTDECTITKENLIGLHELALTYNVKKLAETIIVHIETTLTAQEKYRLYEFCALNQHKELSGRLEIFIAKELRAVLGSDYFLKTSSIIFENILKLECVGTISKPVNEIEILNALVKWINYQCAQNNIKLSERRVKFDDLIRLIRFPVISADELNACVNQSNNLFTSSDILSFSNPLGYELWIPEARKSYEDPNEVEKTGNWFDGLSVEKTDYRDQRHLRGFGPRGGWWKRQMGLGLPHPHGPEPPHGHGPPLGHGPPHGHRHPHRHGHHRRHNILD